MGQIDRHVAHLYVNVIWDRQTDMWLTNMECDRRQTDMWLTDM